MWTSVLELLKEALPIIRKWLDVADRKAEQELKVLKDLDERVKAHEKPTP